MVPGKRVFAAAAAAAVLGGVNATFDDTKPFVLQTEVIKGDASFNGLYLSPFHVGAGEQTIVGGRNASLAIEFVITNTSLIQPIQNGTYFYQTALLPQAPYMSDAPSFYDYISLNFWGGESSSAGFSTDEVPSLQYDGPEAAAFDGWAICRVNGTAPYFGVGPEYQLFWKTKGAECGFERCADIELVAGNVGFV